ncbi:hypothetical protein EN858_30240 [Mesorhizobium sp. M4B.F.Ca.ET.215.01.1.1]|nr:hypothetical protein EOA34_06895 [Mesorhizobium sp. M4B.F.Ca.ET.013.02.1.1]RWX59729.1 hypothetical protein EN780_33800 [Mesorhizobium sp. M4B.F.Ca.ET.089.01.1.1]TGQ05158.1 hypothetical protein EN858_30240 [Mesorhizobium sp. M4B.F.Ca.ET.215.01.1.1]TGQ41121.1 hypothetical protein EN863_020825 [Mesorhizobium sp. M00.F.Ca.ET.220.01.1.1]TGQ97531.1 hypothetical protein EN846_29540 [Mesorhizobium sp. M4B.F.Ca.ET.203.01.1.1]TGT45720.1 hypothetical protein EN812_08790 [Mesorhizobium sp. M4B.F.Ca.ET.
MYLVQGVSGKDVIFPPEFIFLLDVGLDAAVGVSVYWQAHGRGDPDFPDFSAATLRSVLNRSSTGIIFPKIAGELMIVVKTGYKDSDVKAGLEAEGLKNVQGSDFFWTGNCQPFIEQSLCKKLEADLPFVKSAEQNGVARIVDFGPGWSCVRLA